MDSRIRLLVVLAAFALVALPVYGQTGCDDSPENPTVVLALVGSAGGLFSMVRARAKARRKTLGR